MINYQKNILNSISTCQNNFKGEKCQRFCSSKWNCKSFFPQCHVATCMSKEENSRFSYSTIGIKKPTLWTKYSFSIFCTRDWFLHSTLRTQKKNFNFSRFAFWKLASNTFFNSINGKMVETLIRWDEVLEWQMQEVCRYNNKLMEFLLIW